MGIYEPNATIVGREDFSDELMVLRLKPDAEEVWQFEPGQYAELSLLTPEEAAEFSGKLERRQYSIASAPHDTRGLEFYLVLVPEGYLTPKLWRARLGDRVWMNPKIKGKFTLDPVPGGKDLVMISTGTGLAPFISMLRAYRGSDRWRRFVLVHGVRYSHDLGYRAELESLAKEDPSVFYISTVSREPESSDWPGHRGRVLSIFDDGTYERVVGAPFDPEECQVFLCGNPDMIDEAEVTLGQRGFKLHKKKDPGNLHIERYW